MVIFWSFAAVLLLVALVFIWLPYFSRQSAVSSEDVEDRNAQNVEIFKQRLAELEKELADNNLDQPGFVALKAELEKNLLQEVDEQGSRGRTASLPLWAPVVLTMILPVAAAGLYLHWGYSEELTELVARDSGGAQVAQQNLAPAAIEEQIDKLEARLEQEPDNPEGWLILARTYLTLGRFQEAAATFTQITERFGPYPPILSQHAQALYMGGDRTLTPEVQALLDQALELDPLDPGSRGLQGIIAFEQAEYQQAIDHWQAVLESDNPDANREGLESAIREARLALSEAQGDVAANDSLSSAPVKPDTLDSDAGPAEVRVEVTLDQQLRQQVTSGTTVFVVAQAVSGPRMPLAVARLTVADLPAKVLLDDSMAMAPMAQLSGADEVMVRAIVSIDGQARVQPGDLVGTLGPLKVRGGEPVQLLIDQQIGAETVPETAN